MKSTFCFVPFIGRVSIFLFFCLPSVVSIAQQHPRIYVANKEKPALLERLAQDGPAVAYVDEMQRQLAPFLAKHQADPMWIVSRLQMYWQTKYKRVYVNGMDFSHGEGEAPVPTVRFSGSRDWDTDYLVPDIADIKPYMDDPRGLYLQNDKKEGKPWEWVAPSETGHIIERINKKILDLAEDAAFLYWLYGEEKYAVFASDILIPYIEGMHHRDPPLTVENHKNIDLMGLQTFEVIHEGVIRPMVLSYDFLYDYLVEQDKDIDMMQTVFKKWAEQEIKYGVPGNNWNLMQARYITYLALALENDKDYKDGRGQQYYLDQVMNQNSRKQKALKDVMDNFDPHTGIWPEVAHYSIMVSDDILEVFSLMDKSLDNNLLGQFPILEKAILANFNYLFPNGFTTAYGDAKHARLRFRALELLVAQYRKYGQVEKEKLITSQLKRFIAEEAYDRNPIKSLFQLFYYAEELIDVPPAHSIADLVGTSFYSPNVSWVVQRNGHSPSEGMMISKNASLGNHSHANGINLELFAKGMVIAPDAAAGVSYWSADHKEYYSRFPAHNTVVVDGMSNYTAMNSVHAFELKSLYPAPEMAGSSSGDYTFSEVTFNEPATDARQHRLTGTVRTSDTSGYFIDIFRSARNDQRDKKHEYFFHGQGKEVRLKDFKGKALSLVDTDELSTKKGDLKGYNYFTHKKRVDFTGNFIAQFQFPTLAKEDLRVQLWMKGNEERRIFTVKAPYSRAINAASVPEELYHQPSPTLILRQEGEAESRPFAAIIDAFIQGASPAVTQVEYFSPLRKDLGFVGMIVSSENGRKDYIYNHLKGLDKIVFINGSFTGNYGIVSYQDEALSTLFLGKGSSIEKDSYKIACNDQPGAVLVEFTDQGLWIEAAVPFSLQLPLAHAKRQSFKLSYRNAAGDEKEAIGQRSRQAKQFVLAFSLPAGKRKFWRFIE